MVNRPPGILRQSWGSRPKLQNLSTIIRISRSDSDIPTRPMMNVFRSAYEIRMIEQQRRRFSYES